jgi:NTE family protein
MSLNTSTDSIEHNIDDHNCSGKCKSCIMKYENLVLEGGGPYGLVYVGAIQSLEKVWNVNNVSQHIKRFAGSSIGSLLAMCCAIGLTGIEIEKLIMDKNTGEFKDCSRFVVKNIYDLINTYGYCRGDNYYKFTKNILLSKMGDAHITFKQLYEKTNKELVVTATNLNRHIVEYFSHYTTPDMEVALAVRISSGYPFIFRPILHNGCYYADGGITSNYPLYVFDPEIITSANNGYVYNNEYLQAFIQQNKPSYKTLGLNLIKSKSEAALFTEFNSINNIKDFVIGFANTMYDSLNRTIMNNDYWDRSIPIDVSKYTSLEFAVSQEDKLKLFELGRSAVTTFFTFKQ